jgi:hypothetical protein
MQMLVSAFKAEQLQLELHLFAALESLLKPFSSSL